MKTYLATRFDGGKTWAESIEAENWAEAEAIAVQRGWVLEGVKCAEYPCDEIIEAMIQARFNTLH